MSKTIARLLIGALAVALVVACGGASTGTTSSGNTGSGFAGTGSGTPKSVTVPAVGSLPQDATKPPVATITDVVPPIGEGPRVIRTAQIAVEVKNGSFDGTLDKLFTISTSLGGYISGTAAIADTGALRTGTYSLLETQPALGYGDGLDYVGTTDGVVNGSLDNDRLYDILLGPDQVGLNYNFTEQVHE